LAQTPAGLAHRGVAIRSEGSTLPPRVLPAQLRTRPGERFSSPAASGRLEPPSRRAAFSPRPPPSSPSNPRRRLLNKGVLTFSGLKRWQGARNFAPPSLPRQIAPSPPSRRFLFILARKGKTPSAPPISPPSVAPSARRRLRGGATAATGRARCCTIYVILAGRRGPATSSR